MEHRPNPSLEQLVSGPHLLHRTSARGDPHHRHPMERYPPDTHPAARPTQVGCARPGSCRRWQNSEGRCRQGRHEEPPAWYCFTHHGVEGQLFHVHSDEPVLGEHTYEDKPDEQRHMLDEMQCEGHIHAGGGIVSTHAARHEDNERKKQQQSSSRRTARRARCSRTAAVAKRSSKCCCPGHDLPDAGQIAYVTATCYRNGCRSLSTFMRGRLELGRPCGGDRGDVLLDGGKGRFRWRLAPSKRGLGEYGNVFAVGLALSPGVRSALVGAHGECPSSVGCGRGCAPPGAVQTNWALAGGPLGLDPGAALRAMLAKAAVCEEQAEVGSGRSVGSHPLTHGVCLRVPAPGQLHSGETPV